MHNLDIIEISDEQAYNAKLLASKMSESQTRKRGMIDMLGICCATNYLNAKRIRIDSKKSVYKIPLLFEEFKISDIYHGNHRIDVITLYKEKTIKIPRIHVEMDILPEFYFIVQIGSKIKEAKMIGFIEGKKIPRCSCDSKFFYPTLDMIFDLKRFNSLIKQSIPVKPMLGKHIDCLGLFLKFIDNDLSSVYKRQMIQHLMNCDSCRARFIDTMEFEYLAKNIKYYPNLIHRHLEKNSLQYKAEEYSRQAEFGSLEDGIQNAVIIDDQNGNPNFIESNKDDFENDKRTVQMFDIIDPKQAKKGVIDTIFNEIPKIDIPQIKNITNSKNKRKILASVVLIFIIASFMLISFKGTSETIEDNKKLAAFEEFDEEYSVDEYNNNEDMGNYLQSTPKNEPTKFSIKQPISTKPVYSPTITNLSWEAPESLVKKDNYTKFLQLVGKNIKLNLQNDLLLVSDIPVNKTVKIDINISSNGNINSIKLSKSSGSPAIDASIRKVVRDTLTYMKPPSQATKSKPVDITLVVDLS